jgi:aromatic amino acid aminotransferase I / 2-aminoadipate transaminase
MLLDPGDFILVEEFTYPSALEAMHPLQVHTVPVKMDHQGMLDTDLEDILSTWDLRWRGRSRRPKTMYTVTYTPFKTSLILQSWSKSYRRYIES